MELLTTLCRYLIVNGSDSVVSPAKVLLLGDSKDNMPYHLAAKMADEGNQHEALDCLLAALMKCNPETCDVDVGCCDLITTTLETKNSEGKTVLDLLNDGDRQIDWFKRAESCYHYYKTHPFDKKMDRYHAQNVAVTNQDLWNRAGDCARVDEFLVILSGITVDDARLRYVKDLITESKGNALFNAVKCNNIKAIVALLEKDVDIMATDHRGFTVFHQAIENMNYKAMFALVQKYGSRDSKVIDMKSKGGVSTINLVVTICASIRNSYLFSIGSAKNTEQDVIGTD